MTKQERKVPMIRKAALKLLLILICIGSPAAVLGETYSDKIAAVVNGEVILYSDVERHKSPFVRGLSDLPLGIVPPGKWPTEKEILDELIVIHLMEQEAAKQGIQVPEQAVDKSIEEMRQRRGMTQDQLSMVLRVNGVNYADFRKIRKQYFVLMSLYQKEVLRKTTLSEEDAQNYFKDNKGKIDQQFKELTEQMKPARPPGTEEKVPEIPTHEEIYTGGQVRLRQITLTYPSGAKASQKDRVRETARQILREALTGADFAELAKKYSKDPLAKSGGDIGWMKYKDMAVPMQKIVSHMKQGDVRPIDTNRGVMLFFVADEKGRKVNRVRIPERIRRQQQKQLDEMLKKREELQARQREEALERAAEADQEHAGGSGKSKHEKIKDLGILTPEETKEYEKARNKVFFILKTQKTRERMKNWIENLKKNSIIDVRL